MLPADRMARERDADCSARTQSGSGRAGCRCYSKERAGWCRREREQASHWRCDPGGPAAVQAEELAFGACRCLAASQGAGLLAPAREHPESLQRKPSPQEDAPPSSLTPEGLSGGHLNLFVTNGLDRIESRRFDRWIDAKNQTD